MINTEYWNPISFVFKKYCKKYSYHFGFAVFLMIIVAGSSSAIAYMINHVINKILINPSTAQIILVVSVFGSFYLIKGVSVYIQNLLLEYVKNKISLKMRSDFVEKIMSLDVRDIYKIESGMLSSVFGPNIANIVDTFNYIFTVIIRDLLTVICLCVVLFVQDFKLSVIAFAVFPLSLYGIRKLQHTFNKFNSMINVSNDYLLSKLNDVFYGFKTVKIHNKETYECKSFHDQLDKISKNAFKASKRFLISSPLMEIVSGVSISLILIYGGYGVMYKKTTPGSLISFIISLLIIYKPAKSMSGFGQRIIIFKSSVDRFINIMNFSNSVKDQGLLVPDFSVDDILFNNVYFSYNSSNINAKTLSDVSFKISPKSKIGIVGLSGSGKSTILDLLIRSFDINDGSILIGKNDIKDFSLNSLRSAISYSSCDAMIFEDTVRNNIVYSSDCNVDEDELRRIIKISDSEFIYSLPLGLDTVIGKSFSLSFGQRQRILIARGLIKKRQIYLFDEITSSLDKVTESLVMKNIYNELIDKTVIFVTHKLSLITEFDKIIMLQDGKIVDSGSHKDLLSRNQGYVDLFKSQNSNYVDNN